MGRYLKHEMDGVFEPYAHPDWNHMIETLISFIESKGGQFLPFKDEEHDGTCFVATDSGDLVGVIDTTKEIDEDATFYIGVDMFLLYIDKKKAVMGILHELGHALDLSSVNWDVDSYYATWCTLENELRAWENGWKLANMVGFTDVKAYRRYATKCFGTYFRPYMFSFCNHNKTRITICEYKRRISQIGA